MDVGALTALLPTEPRDTGSAAAAALAAGEPKRALAVLDASSAGRRSTGQEPALERALRTAALHMDVNWQPGACLAPVEGLAQAMAHRAGDLPAGGLRLPAYLAGQVIPVLLSARMILGHAGRARDARDHEARYLLSDEDGNERDADLGEGVDEALKWFDELHGTIAETGHPEASAVHLLLAADLRVRAGERDAAHLLVPVALRCAPDTPTSSSLRKLLEGDWELGAPGAAEECVVPPGAVKWGVPPTVAERYTAALTACTVAGSRSGRVAALLRLAHVHRIHGQAEECRTRLAAALDVAREAGDGANTALLRIHRVLDLIEADTGEGAEADVGEAVAEWGRTVGSTSWVHGLAWLVRNRAASWSAQGHARRGDRAETLARLLTVHLTDLSTDVRTDEEGGGDASTTAVPTTGTVVRARHHLAAVVLTDLDQREHAAHIRHDGDRNAALDLTRCLAVVHAAKAFHTQATELGDPEVMAAARLRLELAVTVGELVVREKPGIADPMRSILAGLRSDLAACHAQESLFRSRQARATGLAEEADLLANEALTRARSIPNENELLRCHVRCAALADLGRREQARAEVEALESRLPALQAATLWVRLGSPERARPHLPHIGVVGADAEHPWQLPGLEAEVVLARGEGAHARDAVQHALSGLASYEEHRRRLSRDTLRAAFADDPVPARLHHTAVLARLASGGRDAAAVAFGQAERVRTGFLGAVRALDAAGADPAASAAVRAWLAAEIRWAAEIEEHLAALRAEPTTAPRPESAAARFTGPTTSWRADRPAVPRPDPPATPFADPAAAWRAESPATHRTDAATTPRPPTTTRSPHPPTGDPLAPAPPSAVDTSERRRRLDEAARRLGAAEAAVRRRVPAALSAADPEVVPDAAAMAEALPADTVLLAYHLFDDALVGWAVTRDALCAEPLTGRPGKRALTHQIVGATRRFHDRCARPVDGDHGQDDGSLLATLLLGPFADLLRTARRVVVVPPAALALLPFHALPWDGDVLGAHRAVSYLPAAGLLPRLRARGAQRPWKDLSALLVGSPATDERHRLPALPGTVAETAGIARLLRGGTLLTGAAATRAEILASAPGHEVLHLAAHGVIDELAPHRSRLPLAGDDSLDLADLLTVAHAPRLLVLSACDTGRGRATAGGDVLGLTRAALITGARNAVVSLWPVHDGVGALVMTRMYRHLADDRDADVGTALSLAQQEVRVLSHTARQREYQELAPDVRGADAGPRMSERPRSWAADDPSRDSEPVRSASAASARHPYYWAPFIHVGV